MASPLSSLKQAFKSLTISGVIALLVNYGLAHFDPSAFGPTWGPLIGGLVGVLSGVLTHHNTVNSTVP